MRVSNTFTISPSTVYQDLPLKQYCYMTRGIFLHLLGLKGWPPNTGLFYVLELVESLTLVSDHVTWGSVKVSLFSHRFLWTLSYVISVYVPWSMWFVFTCVCPWICTLTRLEPPLKLQHPLTSSSVSEISICLVCRPSGRVPDVLFQDTCAFAYVCFYVTSQSSCNPQRTSFNKI